MSSSLSLVPLYCWGVLKRILLDKEAPGITILCISINHNYYII